MNALKTLAIVVPALGLLGFGSRLGPEAARDRRLGRISVRRPDPHGRRERQDPERPELRGYGRSGHPAERLDRALLFPAGHDGRSSAAGRRQRAALRRRRRILSIRRTLREGRARQSVRPGDDRRLQPESQDGRARDRDLVRGRARGGCESHPVPPPGRPAAGTPAGAGPVGGGRRPDRPRRQHRDRQQHRSCLGGSFGRALPPFLTRARRRRARLVPAGENPPSGERNSA